MREQFTNIQNKLSWQRVAKQFDIRRVRITIEDYLYQRILITSLFYVVSSAARFQTLQARSTNEGVTAHIRKLYIYERHRVPSQLRTLFARSRMCTVCCVPLHSCVRLFLGQRLGLESGPGHTGCEQPTFGLLRLFGIVVMQFFS